MDCNTKFKSTNKLYRHRGGKKDACTKKPKGTVGWRKNRKPFKQTKKPAIGKTRTSDDNNLDEDESDDSDETNLNGSLAQALMSYHENGDSVSHRFFPRGTSTLMVFKVPWKQIEPRVLERNNSFIETHNDLPVASFLKSVTVFDGIFHVQKKVPRTCHGFDDTACTYVTELTT